jgi:predicted transcriptional regulator
MGKLLKKDLFFKPMVRQILSSFNVPKTPKQIEKELKLNKIKMKPFIEEKLVVALNPNAKKGRLYVTTKKARNLIDLSEFKYRNYRNWDLVGWIMASPKQRMVVMKSMDKTRRTSEKIRERASKVNPHLSRTSTKGILKELHRSGLIDTELIEGKRYYWMNDKGESFLSDIHQFCP